MLKLFKYCTKKDAVYALSSVFLIIMQVWLDLKLPDYMANVTRLVETEGSLMSDILTEGGYMLACALGSLVAAFATGYFVAHIAARLSMRLRERVYGKVIGFSMEELNGFSTASLITRCTNDITQIQMVVAIGMQAMVKAPIMAVWAMIKIAGKSTRWTITTGIAVGVLLIMLSIVFSLVIPKFNVIQKLTDRLNSVTREQLTGIRVVRAYNAEQYQERKFEKANVDVTNTNLFTQRTMTVIQPGMTMIMSGLTLAIYWVGMYMINAADMMDKITLFSDMVVFVSYAAQVIMAFMMLTMTLIVLPRAIVSAKRINEVMGTKTKLEDGTLSDKQSSKQGEIVFKHVSFRYPDAGNDVLHDISFTVHKGETVAFIGSTGSGKSTLVNLIPRFFDVTKGEILIDGINVKEYMQKDLRKKIGYVPQKSFLFRGTVSSNVAYGENKPDDTKIQIAVSISQAEEFVVNMPKKYQSDIAQGGLNVSGGQRQRLAIARAIYRSPEIYIFDDSFSALDYKTDRILRNALKKQAKGATNLIVAQRIGTIMHSDQIIVLDEGRIVGKGTHKELLKSCKVYQEIARSQLTKEEIENAG